jgi:hypothetical protein
MLVLCRVIFTAAFGYSVYRIAGLDQGLGQAGDLSFAGHLAICVVLALLTGLTWAPYFGERITRPVEGRLTEGSVIDVRDRILRRIQWLERKGHRRLALAACFLEGIRRPWLPSAFVIGLRNSKAGTWLEKVYAREVFRFNNAQNCVDAFAILKRHGIDPGPHKNYEINRVLRSMGKRENSDAPSNPVPPVGPPPAGRQGGRIRLSRRAGPEPSDNHEGDRP